MSNILLNTLVLITLGAAAVHSGDKAIQAHPLIMIVTGSDQDLPFQVPVTFEFGDVPGRSYVFQFTFANGKQACESDLDVEPPKFDVTGFKGVVERRMYWNGKAQKGLYLGPALMFKKAWAHRKERVVGNYRFFELDISETSFGALGYLGYAWMPGNVKISWDIGVGFSHVSGTGSREIKIDESGVAFDLNLGVGFVF